MNYYSAAAVQAVRSVWFFLALSCWTRRDEARRWRGSPLGRSGDTHLVTAVRHRDLNRLRTSTSTQMRAAPSHTDSIAFITSRRISTQFDLRPHAEKTCPPTMFLLSFHRLRLKFFSMSVFTHQA